MQTIVDLADSGDEVWVAAGVYTGVGSRVLVMKGNVHIYGGFLGTESERDERDWIMNTSSIDGEDVRGCVLGADNATLDGFLLTRGRASYGGG
ncbi:MAG TPA: hypothetical protein ENN65_01250, partial [Candidatus Hydrogenedentes bacterium]|nr:hypothetical protein [Candidatus Hydrogenedentota bacterium]